MFTSIDKKLLSISYFSFISADENHCEVTSKRLKNQWKITRHVDGFSASLLQDERYRRLFVFASLLDVVLAIVDFEEPKKDLKDRSRRREGLFYRLVDQFGRYYPAGPLGEVY